MAAQPLPETFLKATIASGTIVPPPAEDQASPLQ
jgi:hypothetical protein